MDTTILAIMKRGQPRKKRKTEIIDKALRLCYFFNIKLKKIVLKVLLWLQKLMGHKTKIQGDLNIFV